MRLPVRPGDDGGNAIVEFLYLAVLLMVPLVYVLLSVFAVQRASYALSSAAREAGRAFVTSPVADEAESRARVAVAIVLQDSGLDDAEVEVWITCSARECLTPGSSVAVRVAYDVPLPFLPQLLGEQAPASVDVEGQHLEVVDRYREPAP